MQDKVDSYCTFSKLQLGIFTWNIDGTRPAQFEAASPANQTLLHTFIQTLDQPDLISFNFQEVSLPFIDSTLRCLRAVISVSSSSIYLISLSPLVSSTSLTRLFTRRLTIRPHHQVPSSSLQSTTMSLCDTSTGSLFSLKQSCSDSVLNTN